jgi:hypothetical protein
VERLQAVNSLGAVIAIFLIIKRFSRLIGISKLSYVVEIIFVDRAQPSIWWNLLMIYHCHGNFILGKGFEKLLDWYHLRERNIFTLLSKFFTSFRPGTNRRKKFVGKRFVSVALIVNSKLTAPVFYAYLRNPSVNRIPAELLRETKQLYRIDGRLDWSSLG